MMALVARSVANAGGLSVDYAQERRGMAPGGTRRNCPTRSQVTQSADDAHRLLSGEAGSDGLSVAGGGRFVAESVAKVSA